VLRFVEVDVPAPGPGEVRITVRAAGMNPSDAKSFDGTFGPPRVLPLPVGSEVAGIVDAAGTDSGFTVGQEVLAYRVTGGWATRLTVDAGDVFAKPADLDFPAAANLLLVGATAADLLRTARVGATDTVVLHGASGAVGLSLVQQAVRLGARVVGTCSAVNAPVVEGFGASTVRYGEGLLERLRRAAPNGFDAAIDAVGTDEAIDTSLAVVADRSRIVTATAHARAAAEGFRSVGGADPGSRAFRAGARAELVARAAAGELVVPLARTFPLADAPQALELLVGGHPGGKLALLA